MPDLGKTQLQVRALEAIVEVLQNSAVLFEARAQGGMKARIEIVGLLRSFAQMAKREAFGAFNAALVQIARSPEQAVAHGLHELAAARGDLIGETRAGADDDLGRGGRSRRAVIGDEVGDGEISLMANSGYNGHTRSRNRARNGFFIEGPQIFERAAAAGKYENFRPVRAAKIMQPGADLFDGPFALHLSREKTNVQAAETAFEHMQHVADHGAGG